ncbi:MAG: hypothetical protein Q9207_001175 [Kuettlingeria erythrocarpa]
MSRVPSVRREERLDRSQWFSSAKEAEGQSLALSIVEEVLDDRRQFALDVFSSPRKIINVEAKVNQVYRTTKEILEGEIAGLQDDDDLDIAGHAMQSLAHANTQRMSWATKRTKGARKVGTATQAFLNSFSGFLESYSGIVELVKVADNQYGGLAYGTLSLFLSVAVNKEQQEEMIEDAIGELALNFPRLEILSVIYPSARIRELVAKVYREVILFARASASYYQQSSAEKLFTIMKSPPKSGVKKSVASIRKWLAETRRESECLMQARLSALCEENRRMRMTLDSLDRRDIKRQKNQDRERLDNLRIILDVEKSRPKTHVEGYKNRLQMTFPHNRINRRTAAPMTPELLQADESYQQWHGCEHSCLLVLSGRTFIGNGPTTLSWLSPAAVTVTEQLRDQQQLVAYYYCQVAPNMLDRECPPLQDVMASLVYQLVEIRPELIESGVQKLQATMTSEDWNSEDEGTALETMRDFLIGLLQSFSPAEVVTLVLDRMDRCRVGDSKLSGWILLTQLLQVVKRAACIIKILVVNSTTSWNLGKDHRERLKRVGGDFYVDKLDWHQQSERSKALTPSR